MSENVRRQYVALTLVEYSVPPVEDEQQRRDRLAHHVFTVSEFCWLAHEMRMYWLPIASQTLQALTEELMRMPPGRP